MAAKITHNKCRPQRGAKNVFVLTDAGRWRHAKKLETAAAFVGVLGDDDTSATIWVRDCKCVGNPKCPRSRALVFAAEHYDTATVVTRTRKF